MSPEQARRLTASAPLRYVGVFRDEPVERIVSLAGELKLAAVQLHGNEDQLVISQLREQLPADCQIWKAQSVTGECPARNLPHIDRYVLDNAQGGSGRTFDWSLLQGENLDNVLLAGGLNADNCGQAAQLGCAGLDFNSGVESQPGHKDPQRIAAVFQALRTL